MKEALHALREEMNKLQLTACLVPTTDDHGSEYVHDHFKLRQYLSGFTGSAGTLLVLQDAAYLWTDGRYFLQAEAELAGTDITLMKLHEPGVPDLLPFLTETLKAGDCLGFDGRLLSAAEGKKTEEALLPLGVHLYTDFDPADRIWPDRPSLIPTAIYPLPLTVTGRSAADKLTALRQTMRAQHTDWHLTARLEEIAYLFNLRGNDIAYTPVFYSFALIGQQKAFLYVLDEELQHNWKDRTAEIRPYAQIFHDLSTLTGAVLLDETAVNYALLCTLANNPNATIVTAPAPLTAMKAVKNPTEIACTKNAHRKDGIAMVTFLCWIKTHPQKETLSEITASDYLAQCRRAQPGFRDLSFDTISGYGPNGAIVHYSATPETNRPLQAAGFLLVDSGGQYADGTTDITRTVALGPLTTEMQCHYTAVLKSHIALATATFSSGTKAVQLDEIARKPLRDLGLDFNHGTGHGVGHLLSVHEGPNQISPHNHSAEILPGMITTDEPGLYLTGAYGIRLENELLCVELDNGLRGFVPITLCPFDPEAILPAMLTDDELTWLNAYHEKVRQLLTPLLPDREATWLRKTTAALPPCPQAHLQTHR